MVFVGVQPSLMHVPATCLRSTIAVCILPDDPQSRCSETVTPVRLVSEPGNQEKPQADGNKVLGNPNRNVRHFQRAYQSYARPITAEGTSYHPQRGANCAYPR